MTEEPQLKKSKIMEEYGMGMTMSPLTPKMKPMANNNQLIKYWYQRYNLFSRFDDGIMMDDVSWYSVTPEIIAEHIAKKVASIIDNDYLVIVDGFCGVGGNLIQFACASPLVRVIGCDINENRLRMAKHNAKIYGVQHQCEFILGDFMKIIPSLRSRRVDAVFLSPPWGGVGYLDTESYSLSSMTPDGFEIIHLVRKYLTKNIAFLMPRNIDLAEVKRKLLDKTNPYFEFEQNMVGNKIKTITVYFGDLVNHDTETDTE